jgi:hypothetical protein
MDSQIPPNAGHSATPTSAPPTPASVDTPARVARVVDFDVVIESGDGEEDPHIRQEFQSVDDLIAYHEAVVAEGVRALVNKAMDDRSVGDRLSRLPGAPPGPAPAEPVFMRLKEYAARVGYSKRTIEAFVARDLPTVGHGRLLRVEVRSADEWIRSLNGQRQKALDDITEDARQDARRSARGKGGT